MIDWARTNTQDTSKIYEFVNRRWYEETGHYPDGPECQTVVMMVAILTEFHGQTCPAVTDTPTYLRAVPSRKGSPVNKPTMARARKHA